MYYSTSDDDVISAVVRWVNAKTGLPTARAYSDWDEPNSGQYMLIDLVSVADATQNSPDDEFIVNDDSASVANIVEKHFDIEVRCYRDDPSTVMRRLKSNLRVHEFKMMEFGLIAHSASDVILLKERFNNKYEPRAQMNLSVRGYIADHNAVEVIENVTETIFTRTG